MDTTTHDDKLLAAFDVLSKHGTLLIIWALSVGAQRQIDMLKLIPVISVKTLSKRLYELEEAGIVMRTVYPEMPVRIEYSLTDSGVALANLVSGIEQWADEWAYT
ncbi:winged helix-turn-helix transcriptional regulator [Alicyclobacillus sp. ALC3]|uniref:winged helix-turn-helix transcriptional regulator n=1 Tax=Alicyclobacillus sp. ALC3 TaxID=2796143 RepID=UPI0023798ECA|nr:helix-turn-helix domain-containing protein [Alicyclobacillus sp. ALC3]WDL97717.1 helix-turn-helix transcriptional regulator [Alicyclobacillus sp. ALC3]